MLCVVFLFFFKQKTAYEMRISDWSSDVCSSDLDPRLLEILAPLLGGDLKQIINQLHWKPPGARAEFGFHQDSRLAPEDFDKWYEIGRASCRERVCQYV